ncbi:hypothetical protein B0H14DRAFT_3470100 [Mycena olivaceomarginata]|nr:hypothetical protein B0H14DRAFT_3470100 [Mycena olivaceomarginata]
MPLYVIGVDTVGHICLCAYALLQDLHGNVKPPILLMTTLVFCLNVVWCALLRVVGSAPSIWDC